MFQGPLLEAGPSQLQQSCPPRTHERAGHTPTLQATQRILAPGGGPSGGTQASSSGQPSDVPVQPWQGRQAWDRGPGPRHAPSAQTAQSPVDIPLQQPLQQGTELGGEGVGQLHGLQGGADVGRGRRRVLAPGTERQRPASSLTPEGVSVLTTQGWGASGAGGQSKDEWPEFGENRESTAQTRTGDPSPTVAPRGLRPASLYSPSSMSCGQSHAYLWSCAAGRDCAWTRDTRSEDRKGETEAGSKNDSHLTSGMVPP